MALEGLWVPHLRLDCCRRRKNFSWLGVKVELGSLESLGGTTGLMEVTPLGVFWVIAGRRSIAGLRATQVLVSVLGLGQHLDAWPCLLDCFFLTIVGLIVEEDLKALNV